MSSPDGLADDEATAETTTGAQHLRRAFQIQKQAYLQDMAPDRKRRTDRLDRLARLIERHDRAFAKAISADFGHRSHHETQMMEILPVLAAIKNAKRHLGSWMQTRRLPTARHFRPGQTRLIRQPLGVVGIVAPWNYPLQLSAGPAVGALAAGNRVMIKPSDSTPRFAALFQELARRVFGEDELLVVDPDAETARAFVALPFDHLLFTGSAQTGRLVAAAAAPNLTPVTLELGGKSPAIVDPSANLAKTALRLAQSKLVNAGQTCVAPDYALVPTGYEEHLVDLLRKAITRLYPRIIANPDYSSIINERHFTRLKALLADAHAKGATIIEINPGRETADPSLRKFLPTLVLGATGEMRLMQEEIFGPILPILTYDDLGDVIAGLGQCDRPLALYWFGEDHGQRERVLQETVSGGVTINDCLWHAGQENAPFGGVGASGSGAYHGEYGFRTFSQEKTVFLQGRRSGISLLYPPYGVIFRMVMTALRRMI
ncbi:coniferyl aldehyde dehydrogenase [Telmatospirillum siberiense]|uniref:Aldehyde dehydrogenase n=2 Tax=Telmatospirillum siberiense TaxID=382514 RepID=A0A2N3PR65_9PROT|nr:coniferyl aldehyde dehydrogenase [Telmatospirillum siberiense]